MQTLTVPRYLDNQSQSHACLDVAGCPTDYTIMGTLREVNGSGQVLQANFDAFKFPTSDIVQFRALVTPCIPRCGSVDYCVRLMDLKSIEI